MKKLIVGLVLAFVILAIRVRPLLAMDAEDCARIFGPSITCPNGSIAQFSWDPLENMCRVVCVQPQ